MPFQQPLRLLDRVREAIRLKHFSLSTETSYVYYVRDYILFHDKRHSKDMEVSETRVYLSHLATVRHVSRHAYHPLYCPTRHLTTFDLPVAKPSVIIKQHD